MTASSPASKPSLPPSTKLRVLVADDEPLIRQALQRVLERRGHEVVVAVDAHAAVEELALQPFDVVFVDQRMPGDGSRVLAHLEETGFAGRAVLMTGGHPGDIPDVHEGVQRLQKPFPFGAIVPLAEGGARS